MLVFCFHMHISLSLFFSAFVLNADLISIFCALLYDLAASNTNDPTDYRSSVYILLKKFSDSSHYIPRGTAFPIMCATMSVLLTAGHCIVSESVKNEIDPTWHIAKSGVREGYGIQYEEIIPVEVVHARDRPDFGVLRRTDGMRFSTALPLGGISLLPPLRITITEVVVYHCAVDNFRNNSDAVLSCEVSDYHNIAKWSERYFCMPFLVSGGSSGGAVVNKSGFVIGIVLSTHNPSIDFDGEENKGSDHSVSLSGSMNISSQGYTKAIMPAKLSLIFNGEEYKLMHWLNNN